MADSGFTEVKKQDEEAMTARLNKTLGSREEDDFFDDHRGESYSEFWFRTKQSFVGGQINAASSPSGYTLSSSPNRDQGL
jgi:hypothetical protein